jgi:hypothetical protein
MVEVKLDHGVFFQGWVWLPIVGATAATSFDFKAAPETPLTTLHRPPYRRESGARTKKRLG